MTVEWIDLSPSQGRRLPRPGASRRAWIICALGAVLTLAFAGALEYANRAKLREQLQMPLSAIDPGALRDLATAMEANELDPYGGSERMKALAEKHPEPPVGPYALWLGYIAAIGDDAERAELALRAAQTAPPDDPRYAIYVDTAAMALNNAGRQDEAIALVEDALKRAGPEHQERLQKALQRAGRESRDGD